MPYSYEHNTTHHIIEVSFSGETTSRDLQECTSALIAIEKEKDINRFLIDTNEMIFSAKLLDIYNLPAKQYIQEGADREGRVAIVYSDSPREKEAVEFYETACRNRGWDVHAFQDRQEALNWLLQNPSPD